jgi:DNA-binding response OmpR family regulator
MTFESPSSGKVRIAELVARSPATPASILIIDDDPWVCQALRLVLRHYDVTVMRDASAALNRIRQGERFDAILCDVVMPHVGGAALYETLLAEAPKQASRVLFMTAGATSEAAMDFIDQHRARVLIKPFPPEELRLEIASLLARHAPDDEGSCA